MAEKMYDKQEQLRAAYALNMCTVSVSQIVDYNDEYILEQEYEAILNNLNLEQMPKDEALLNILVKLLNVITFFRIDKVKREQIEKRYQRRVKNAIWSAVPNIGVIVAGDPVTVALSLATQVGIGYMNYRREKANALADKEDSEVELKITAMEQFNALRRELFTTAWRLADEYNFPDEYRLTERQITQYNKILMDPDEIRKYERLMAVQDKFEAYLPFWYFMGHTAKYISEDNNNGLNEEARKYYRIQAKEHFEKYNSLNSYNILREDELTASFALEYVDLLLLEDNPDYEKIVGLIDTAVKMAGNANDILEMCAFSYLKIGRTEDSEKLLRILVNEDYNKATNSKLLSRIYVSEYITGSNPLAKTQYEVLATRVSNEWLFPMPDNLDNKELLDKKLQDRYLDEQKTNLQKGYADVITQFIEKYIIKFNKIILIPGIDESDENYTNVERAVQNRRQAVFDLLESDKSEEFRIALRDSGFRFRYVELINEMFSALDGLSVFADSESKDDLISSIREKLAAASEDLKEIQEKLNLEDGFSIMEYERIQKSFSFERLTKEFFDIVKERASEEVDKIESLDKLDELEYEMIMFCRGQGIAVGGMKNKRLDNSEGETVYISSDVLGSDEHDESFSRVLFNKMEIAIKEAANSLIDDASKVGLLIRGDEGFDLYFKNIKLQLNIYKPKTLAILDDRSFFDNDLLITCDGVLPVKRGKNGTMHEYKLIEYKGKSLSLGWPEEYSNKAVNLGNLFGLFEKLRDITNES